MALRLPSQNKAFRPSKPRPRAPVVNPSGPSKSAGPGPTQPGPKRKTAAPGASERNFSQDGAVTTQESLPTQTTQGPPGLTQGPTQASQDTILATPHGKTAPLPSPDATPDVGDDGAGAGGKGGDFAIPEPRTSTLPPSPYIPSSPAQAQQPIPSSPSLSSSDLSTQTPVQAPPVQRPGTKPTQMTPRKGPLPARSAGVPGQRTRPPSTAPSSSSASASKGGRLSLLSAAKQAATSGSGKPSPGRLPSRSRSTSVRAPSVPPATEDATVPVSTTPTTQAVPSDPVASSNALRAADSVDDNGAQNVSAAVQGANDIAPSLPRTDVPDTSVTFLPSTSIRDVSPVAEPAVLIADADAAMPNAALTTALGPATSAVSGTERPTTPDAEPDLSPVASEVTNTAATFAASPPPPAQSPARQSAPPAEALFLLNRSPSPSRASAPPAADASSKAPSSSGRSMSASETAAAAQAILDSLVLQRNTGRPAPRAEGRRLSPKARSSPGILVTKRAYRDKTVKSQQAARKEAEANGLELPEYLERKRKLRTRSESAPTGDATGQGEEAVDAPTQKRARTSLTGRSAVAETSDGDEAMGDAQDGEVDELAQAGEEEAPPAKKKRGRPKKVVDEDAPPKEKRPRGRPRKVVEEPADEAGDAAPVGVAIEQRPLGEPLKFVEERPNENGRVVPVEKEKRPRGRPRKERPDGAQETQGGTVDGDDAQPKEKRPRGRQRKNPEEESAEKRARIRPREAETKNHKEKALPAFSQVSLVGFEAGDTVGEGVDVNLLTMADLATNIFSGQITAKGVQLDEMMQVERSNKRVRGQHNAWNGWTRAQLSRRKVRREQNAERERRRQAIREEGGDPMGEVTEDEPDSEEEFEVTPNRYTPPPEDERIGRVAPTVLGQQPPEYGGEVVPAPGDEDGADGDGGQRRRGPEGGEDDDDYDHHDEPEEDYANMGVELRVADDEPEEADGGLAAAGFAVADDEDLGAAGGGDGGDDDDEDYDYDAMQEDGTYDLAQYHAEREAQRERDLAERENRAVIEENDDLTMVNSRTYAKIVPRGIPWTEADMLTMYMALSEVGPNSDIVTGYFPGRTRKQVNRKMVKEQRANPDKFWAAVANKREVDVEHLKISAAYDDHEDWTIEDEFLEQCKRDAEACRDDYVPPPEDEAANEEGLQQMAEENEKHDDKEDDDDYDVADVGDGEEEDDGERVVIEGYEPEDAGDQQDKDDDYDYENEQ